MMEQYDNIDLNNEVSASMRNIRCYYRNKVKLEVVNVSLLNEFKMTIYEHVHLDNTLVFKIKVPNGYPNIPIIIRPIGLTKGMKRMFNQNAMKFHSFHSLIEGLLEFSKKCNFDNPNPLLENFPQVFLNTDRYWLTTKNNVSVYRSKSCDSVQKHAKNKKRISRKCQTYKLKQEYNTNQIMHRLNTLQKENGEFKAQLALQSKSNTDKSSNIVNDQKNSYENQINTSLQNRGKKQSIKQSNTLTSKMLIKTGNIKHIVCSELKYDFENTTECFIFQSKWNNPKIFKDELAKTKDLMSSFHDQFLQNIESLKIDDTNDSPPILNVSHQSLHHLLFDKGVGILQISQENKRLFETMAQNVYSNHPNIHLIPFNEVDIRSKMLYIELGISPKLEIDNLKRCKMNTIDLMLVKNCKIDPESVKLNQSIIHIDDRLDINFTLEKRKECANDMTEDEKMMNYKMVDSSVLKNQISLKNNLREIIVKDKTIQVTPSDCEEMSKNNMDTFSVFEYKSHGIFMKTHDDDLRCSSNENSNPSVCMLTNDERNETNEDLETNILLNTSEESLVSKNVLNKSVNTYESISDHSTSSWVTKYTQVVTVSKDDQIYNLCLRLSQLPICLNTHLLEELEFTIELDTDNPEENAVLNYLKINTNDDSNESIIEFYTSNYESNTVVFVKDISVRSKPGKESFVRLHKIRKDSAIHKMVAIEYHYNSFFIQLNNQIYLSSNQLTTLWPVNYMLYLYSSFRLCLEYTNIRYYLQHYLKITDISINKITLFRSAFYLFDRISETFE